MEKTKITKEMILTAIKEVALSKEDIQITVGEVEVSGQDIIGFVENEIGILNKRKESAKKRRGEKADALKDAVLAVLTSVPQTMKEVMASLEEDEEVTEGKVRARLSALARDGVIVKEQVKTEDNRRIVGYALATVAEDEE